MAFSRNSLVAAVAGTLSLAVLTGCPAAAPTGTGTPTPGTGATPGAGATPAASPVASPAASPAAPTSPGASPTAQPVGSPSASTLAPTTLRGRVFDEAGALVNTANATVRVESLNPSNPFDTTVQILNGAYVANNVPAGVQLRITATAPGFTNRTRVETLLPLTSGSVQPNIDFGGSEDAVGTAYFISDYPEVESVEPADLATNVDPKQFTIKLNLSEALDASNQTRFVAALRVYPVNNAAGANGAYDLRIPTLNAASTALSNRASDPDAEIMNSNVSATTGAVLTSIAGTGSVPTSTINAGATAYNVTTASVFASNAATIAKAAWDASGKSVTLTFNAPQKTQNANAGRYQVTLVHPAGGTNVIQDSGSKALGQTGTVFGATNNYGATVWGNYAGAASASRLIQSAFKATTLSLGTGVATMPAVERWARTHQNASQYEVAQDKTAPTLTSVSVVPVQVSSTVTVSRIVLTFSEPMAAYAGSPDRVYENVVGQLLGGTNGLTFSVGTSSTNPATELNTGTPAATEFGATGATGLTPGNVYSINGTNATVAINPANPAEVWVTGNQTSGTGRFGTDVTQIRVRVGGSVLDPAGNAVQATSGTTSNVAAGSVTR